MTLIEFVEQGKITTSGTIRLEEYDLPLQGDMENIAYWNGNGVTVMIPIDAKTLGLDFDEEDDDVFAEGTFLLDTEGRLTSATVEVSVNDTWPRNGERATLPLDLHSDDESRVESAARLIVEDTYKKNWKRFIEQYVPSEIEEEEDE